MQTFGEKENLYLKVLHLLIQVQSGQKMAVEGSSLINCDTSKNFSNVSLVNEI